MKLLRTRINAVDHVLTGAEARRERLLDGLSLRSMALLMGVSAALLSMLERGNRRWSPGKVEQFNRALKIRP